MERVVYIDVLFLANLLINYMLLLATAKVLKHETSQKRLWSGSILGALYSVFMFFPSLQIFYSFIFKAVFSISIVFASFKTNNWRNFVKLLFTFYAVCFAFGGGLYALYELTYAGKYLFVRNGVPYIDLPMPIFVLFTAISYAVIRFSYATGRRRQREQIIALCICVDGKQVHIPAFLDTGNMLCDPITKRPVIIADFMSVQELIPPEMKALFLEAKPPQNTAKDGWENRFMLISFNGAGVSGILPSFKPDSVTIESGGRKQIKLGTLIGVIGNRLSKDGHYGALIGPGLLEEG